jgi:ABC-type spermidine/putrescine transport system permease subunit I
LRAVDHAGELIQCEEAIGQQREQRAQVDHTKPQQRRPEECGQQQAAARIQAAIERIPGSLLEASSDLGARSGTTFWKVIFPLAMPGIAAGSIFTFSLTLGDYIIPQVIGDSTLFIGQVVYRQQGVAGNVPFAAAFSLVPIVVIGIYLWIAKRLGAFDAL